MRSSDKMPEISLIPGNRLTDVEVGRLVAANLPSSGLQPAVLAARKRGVLQFEFAATGVNGPCGYISGCAIKVISDADSSVSEALSASTALPSSSVPTDPTDPTDSSVKAAAIVPLVVDQAWRAQGVGSALVRAALDAAYQQAFGLIFVLGKPDFYGRFGFHPSGVGNGFGARKHFLVLELKPGALAAFRGSVVYPEPLPNAR